MTDYLQPLTLWLYAHPHWALFITFLISFSESLAIIGSIIPGSVTMTAIGILAGSGVMRIDLTFIAATLGAIAGDSGSYALGYTFRDRLINIWPFSKYPKWITYGQDYFTRHGAASIFIGRFVGPMRSITPVIAGMMHMNHWHFLLANVLSAIAWSILYVTPGILIGVASSELSPESATRLFVLILILLVIIWLASLGIKWLLVHTNQFLRTNLHDAWTRLQHHPRLAYFIKTLVPHDEVNHYPTAALTLSFFFCFAVSIIMIALVWQESLITTLNNPVYLFFQSLRTHSFDAFFIIISLIVSPLPLFTLMVAITIYTIYYRDWRTLGYWLSLGLTSGILIFLLTFLLGISKTNGLTALPSPLLCPDIDLTLATSLFGFLIFYINSQYRSIAMLMLRIFLFIVLLLAGIASIYLGDNWISSTLMSYFIGLTNCLFHWILYRRNCTLHQRSQLPIFFACFLLILASFIPYALYFKKLSRSHTPHLAQYVITDEVWWNQRQPLLPIYSNNRVGKRTGLLNIQYMGSITKLQHALEASGWKQQPLSFFYSLLLRAGGRQPAEKLPFVAQLYENEKPMVVMTYNLPNKKVLLILRLWRSNYHLRHYRQPIWLGSVDRLQQSSHIKTKVLEAIPAPNYIMEALDGFKFNQIILPKRYLQPLSHPASSILLMIKDPDAKEDSTF